MIRKRWIVAAMTLAAVLCTSSALAHQPSATSASDGESLGRDGAVRAAEAAGKADKARAYYTQIVTLRRERMDSERQEIQRAKSFLGSRRAG